MAIFGSVARETMRPDADVDLLLVVNPLPRGQLARMQEFEAVDDAVAPVLERLARNAIHTTLSPVLKTPAEVEKGSPLFLDMTDRVKVFYDRNGFLQRYLGRLRDTLGALGAGRVHRGGGYYWLPKPDYKPGEKTVL